MAKEELGKLSPEQIQKLAGTISEAKSLTGQQEEIIKRVLAGETEIGNLRVSSLEKYFDIYSRNLDLVARKHSALNDTFLILDKKLATSYRALSSDVNKLEQQLTRLAKSGTSQSANNFKPAAGQTTSRDTAGQRELSNSIRELLKNQENSELVFDDSQQLALLSSIQELLKNQEIPDIVLEDEQQLAILSEILGALQKPVDRVINIEQQSATTPDIIVQPVESKKDLSADSALLAQVGPLIETARAFFQQSAPLTNYAASYEESADRSAVEELAAADSSGGRPPLPPIPPSTSGPGGPVEIPDPPEPVDDVSADVHNNIMLSQRMTMISDAAIEEEALAARQEELLANLVKKAEAVNKARLDLAIARSQKEEAIEARSVEHRLTKLSEVLDAQTRAQEFLNNITAEIKFAAESADEAAKLQADGRNAKELLASAEEQAAARAKFIAEEEREALLANNGVLLAADAARIRQAADAKFKFDTENLNKITQARRKLESRPELAAAREQQMAVFIEQEKYKLQKKYKRLLNEEELRDLRKRKEEEFELTEENLERIEKIRQKQEAEEQKNKQKDRAQKGDQAIHAAVSGPLTKDHSLADRIVDLAKIARDAGGSGSLGETITAGLIVATKAISDLVAQLDTSIDKIASNKGFIDTRLQGSNNKTVLGSYWDQLQRDMMSVGAVTPYFKQEDFANNIKTLVDKGISFDLKQRAFLMTVQEKIANTFNVADGTLLRLIRIQQEDSTAGRLGMESALNSFLNEMYETSEYLSDVATSVRSSLEEMEALMSGAEATEVEYQVQKWMGSLYSVGMSQTAVQSIAAALGQLAAGEIEALTSGTGAGNLLVMAANEAGLTISDILTEGLNANETNKLLQATVNYLAELANSSKDNQVVQQQLASVFGVKASDLRAATNLATNDTTSGVFGSYLTYDNMLKQLNNMAGSMWMRTSIGEMMTNVWENGQYTIASSMANNPISYIIYKLASLLDATVGGINIPALSVAGFGVDLETTVADLMRVAAVSTGIVGSLGSIISGLSSSFSGQAMLSKMGINEGSGLQVTPRGTGDGIGAADAAGGGAQTVSGSGYVGNASSSDIKNTTLQEAEDTKKQQMIEAKEEAEATQIDFINTNVLQIYELLNDVANGKRSLQVKVEGYGLTKLNNSATLSPAQGGVAGLLSNNANAGSGDALNGGFSSGNGGIGGNGGAFGGSEFNSGRPGSSSSSGVNGSSSVGVSNSSSNSSFGSGLGNGIDLGGWTMI